MYLYRGIISDGCAEAIDEHTVAITTDIPFPPFESLLTLWHGILNPAVIEANGGYEFEWNNPEIMSNHPLEGLYSGPYKVTEYVPGAGGYVKLEENEYWWGEPPKTKTVILEWDQEVSTKILKLKKGDTDWIWQFPTTSIPELMGVEGITVENAGLSWIQNFVTFSGLDPLGMDENGQLVRQALCYSFPYDSVLKYVYGNLAVRLESNLPKGVDGQVDYYTTTYNFDLNKTAELLDQAGYTADPETGERLTLEMQYAIGNEDYKQIAIMWKAELEKVGVNLEINEIMSRMVRTQMREGVIDIALSGWFPDFADPYHFAVSLIHSYGILGIYGSHWAIPELDQQIDDTMLEKDYATRVLMYDDVQKVAAENPGRLLVAQKTAIVVSRDWVQGYRYNAIFHCDLSTMYKSWD
jgi:peptide/nickel transport system substrate-binding protein